MRVTKTVLCDEMPNNPEDDPGSPWCIANPPIPQIEWMNPGPLRCFEFSSENCNRDAHVVRANVSSVVPGVAPDDRLYLDT